MRKILAICAFLAVAAGSASAQPITIMYKGESKALTPFERDLIEFNGLRYYEIHLDSPRTLTSLVEVVCRGGEMTEEELMFEGYTVTGTSRITLWAQGVSADSVKVRLTVDGGMSIGPKMVQLDNNKHYILMETYDSEHGAVIRAESDCEPGIDGIDLSVTYPAGDTVPLVAYTTGLRKEIELDGRKWTFVDYCGLRDKHVHPSRWHDEFGVENYIYYVARFE